MVIDELKLRLTAMLAIQVVKDRKLVEHDWLEYMNHGALIKKRCDKCGITVTEREYFKPCPAWDPFIRPDHAYQLEEAIIESPLLEFYVPALEAGLEIKKAYGEPYSSAAIVKIAHAPASLKTEAALEALRNWQLSVKAQS